MLGGEKSSNIQLGNDTLDSVVATEESSFNENSDVIASTEDNSSDVVSSELNNTDQLSWGNEHSFSELQEIIDNATEGDEINLEYDYSRGNSGPSIIISKNLTINGNNHFLDGCNGGTILEVTDPSNKTSLILKDIQFKNGGMMDNHKVYTNSLGGAISHKATVESLHELTLINCDFEYNGAAINGGAVYWIGGALKLEGCTFSNNAVEQGHGGAVYFKSDVYAIDIRDCRFSNNKVKHGLGTFDIVTDKNWQDYYSYFNLFGSSGVHPPSGGAVFCELTRNSNYIDYEHASRFVSHIYNSVFESNQVGERNEMCTAGGAIHAVGFLEIHDSSFNSNIAYDEHGGAILSHYKTKIYNSSFTNNIANCGGAISCFREITIEDSIFTMNGHELDTTWAEHMSVGEILGGIPEIGEAISSVCDILDIFGIEDAIYTISMGGAVYSGTNANIKSCKFERNYASEYGGAIFTEMDSTIRNCSFSYNDAYRGDSDIQQKMAWQGRNRDGGAVHAGRNAVIKDSNFTRNTALYDGGAVYCHGKCDVSNSRFIGNEAKYKGAAISAKTIGTVFNSTFRSNLVFKEISGLGDALTRCDGGAIYIYDECNSIIDTCEFDDNDAKSRPQNDGIVGGVSDGGAIFVDSKESTLTVKNSIFTSNWASEDAGAIYCRGKTNLYGSKFENNVALGENPNARSFGGAVRSEGDLYVENCEFNENEVRKNNGKGGAIYADSKLTIKGSNFTDNSAEDGGAVYANIINDEISNSIFRKNRATDGDGGAIYIDSESYPKVRFSTFDENTATGLGGAIYTDDHGSQVSMVGSNFNSNSAKEGGAVYISKGTEIENCVFKLNKATDGDGGALYINRECNPYVFGSTFEYNKATKGKGGGIYLDSKKSYLKLYNSAFTGNVAKEGGGVYAHQLSRDTSLVTFTQNEATSGNGGGLYVAFDSLLDYSSRNVFSYCTFNLNTAHNGKGGAIYFNSKYSWIDEMNHCTFTGNIAKDDGGAIYAHQLTYLKNSVFRGNQATAGDGGAVFIRNDHPTDYSIVCYLENNIFDRNAAAGMGGGICMGSQYDTINIHKCTFEGNAAGKGGGVYADKLKTVSESIFLGNRATAAQKGDGGAIYVNNDCTFELWWSRFQDNLAANRGGAIYTDSVTVKINKMQFCAFVDNRADKRDYYGNDNLYYGPGHDIFNSGYYPDYFNACWYGTNTPNFDDGRLISYRHSLDDRKVNPGRTGVLTIGIWHNCYETHHEDKAIVGNTYQTAIVFFADNGKEQYKAFSDSDPFYHSAGTFWGNSMSFKVYEPEKSNVFATFVMGNTGWNRLYGKIDYQTVYVDLRGEAKSSSTVSILSCEDVKYPNALKVTYTINPKTASSYVIKDSLGEIVKTGSLNPNQNTAYIEGLTPGSYSITIRNSENFYYSAGSATKTFNIAKGDIEELRVVVYNKTYPEDVECIVYASVDGEYNLTVGDVTGVVTVTNGVGYINIGTLENGTYEADVNFTENSLYVSCSNFTTFVVYSQGNGTYFVVDINATEIDYGQTALVTHVLSENAVGNITYWLSDGTFLGELPVNENLTLPILEPGYYVIIANYTGDENYPSDIDSVGLMVNRLDSGFTAAIVSEDGVVNYYIQYGEIPIVANVLDSNATGTIRYLFNGTMLGETEVCERYNLDKLHPGVYNIIAEYSGDGHFKNASASFTLYVLKASYFKISINSSDSIPYGQNFTVTHELPYGAVGSIRYYLLDGESGESEGILLGEEPVSENFTITRTLDVGTYSIFAVYSGDNDYEQCTSIKEFVICAISPEFALNITANETAYGETPTVFPILPPIGGNVSYYLSNGTFLGEFSVVETLTLPVWDVGTYIIVGKYSGDNNHLSVTANITLIVNKAQPAFEIGVNESEIIYNTTTFVTFALRANATGNITYYLGNGTILGVLPVNETLTLPFFDVGTYLIIGNYSGDKNFLNATANATLTVYKVQTDIFVEMLTTTYRSDDCLVITVKDINKNPAAGIDVAVDLNGVKNYTTDKNGQIKVPTYGLAVKTYDVAICFNGTNNYFNSSNATTVVINKRPSVLVTNPLTTTYENYKYLVVHVRDDLNRPICNEETSITVNGVTYNCTTDSKGDARLIIRLDAKVYKAKVVFDNDKYASSSAKVKVTVKKATPKIIAKKKTFKKAKKVKKYTVTLKANGKALAKKKLTLKINGKTYKAITNAKGKAVFKIKKLTEKGKFKGTVTFKGNYLYKKVTKKVKIVIK